MTPVRGTTRPRGPTGVSLVVRRAAVAPGSTQSRFERPSRRQALCGPASSPLPSSDDVVDLPRIAIDMDAATNYRGIEGTMDRRVVEIFKRWGFDWGGDWRYTDPMHFELGAILTPPGR